MSGWSDVFLGVIAFSTLTTAVILIALLVSIIGLARKMTQLAARFEQELAPVFANLRSISADAAKATSLATAQVERVDQLFGDLAAGVNSALDTIQTFVSGPLRKGSPFSAAVSAFWAVLSVIRQARGGSAHGKADDEDPLFI